MEITFEKVGDNVEITDNKNPANNQWMPGKGKRIFPDWKTKDDNTARNQVYVKVKVGIPNIQVHLKAFDVDDPSDDTAIDTNDATGVAPGQDNLELDPIDHLAKPPIFSNGSETIVCTTDSEGIAKFSGNLPRMDVTMQPGDNFRVAVAVMQDGATELNKVQVTDKNATGYICGDSTQNPTGFNGVVSPMLTTWRKLHMEVDSMVKWTGDKPSPDIVMATSNGQPWQLETPSRAKAVLTLSSSLPEGNNFYAGGYIKQGSTTFEIDSNTTSTITVLYNPSSPPTPAQQSSFNQSFEVYDDDDAGLTAVALPKTNLISNELKQKFIPSYIEVVELAPDVNTTRTIAFESNNDIADIFSNLDSAQNLSGADRHEFWYHLLVAAYQPEPAYDNDPIEDFTLGATGPGIFGYNNFSVIYVETIRDENDGERGKVNFTQIVDNRIIEIAAHEIGHAPGGGNEGEDHAEGGLMAQEPDEPDFTPLTIRRFRSTERWQQ